MDKLHMFVCENFADEFKTIINNENFDDVDVCAFPCICEEKSQLAPTQKMLQGNYPQHKDGAVICGKDCVLSLSRNIPYKVTTTRYCHKYFTDEEFLSYLLCKGSYVIGPAWLKKWDHYIKEKDVYTQEVKTFYNDHYTDLIFFDYGVGQELKEKCEKLANFLALPYIYIPFDTSFIEHIVKYEVYKWRLEKQNKEFIELIEQAQEKCAQYSAIFEKIGKIASYTSKRQAIGEIKRIFTKILGAHSFQYYNFDAESDGISDDIKNLFLKSQDNCILAEDKDKFLIKINNKDKIFGIIETGHFANERYLEQYMSFAQEISKVCGLVLYNIEQYENVIKSEKELLYLSYHDALTGLYNRGYINEVLKKDKVEKNLGVFIFDIDRLKAVNDHYGHLEGDKIIKKIAEVLKSSCRETDSIARIGGDEFMAILPNCSEQTAHMFKNRILKAFETKNKKIEDAHLKLNLSIGFVIAENEDCTLEALMQKADERMYADKLRRRKLLSEGYT